VRTAKFQIVGTEMAPRPQGQIGAQVYHLDGALSTKAPALELQPWNNPISSGPEPDIDGRGDFVMVGSTIYVRANTFTEWQTITGGDPYWGVFADINPALWQVSSNSRVLGEASVGDSPTWVLLLTNRFGSQFKTWIRKSDGHPLRYTASWINAKGATYYVNALYSGFNGAVEISTPDMLNRGIANPGAPVALPSGSVTITKVDFDCVGSSSRRPAPHNKFVLVTLAFVDSGPGQVAISPDAWRLYGDGVNGAAPIDPGGPGILRAQILRPGDRVSGEVMFDVAEDAYQLMAVGHLVGATAVMNAGLPILPNGTLPCSLLSSGWVDADVRRFEGQPHLPSFDEIQVLQCGRCDLCHQRDLPANPDPHSVPQQLDAARPARPDVARAAFRTIAMQRHRARVNHSKHFSQVGIRGRHHRTARQLYRAVIRDSAEQVYADQVCDVLRPRVLRDLGDGARLDEVAVLHDDEAIGERHGLERVVGHHQPNTFERFEVAFEIATDLGTCRHVEGRQRFVQQKQARVWRERSSECDALSLPT